MNPDPEITAHLDAHVSTIHTGLETLLAMLQAVPADAQLRAAGLRVLLQPLADEASQAEPLARMLAHAQQLQQREFSAPAPPCTCPPVRRSLLARCARIGRKNCRR